MAQIDINDFDAIRIGLASPKQIRDWSMGEVTKPETINYRTLKPERDGLFCERIFGPTKDWECYCGKYKRVRYKGIICERCGVEVTRQKVRRERMGHIDLAAPVSHIWFFKGVPSRIGYLLDIAPRELEKVLYFAASIVTGVDHEKRAADLADLEDKVRGESEQIYVDRDEQLAALDDRIKRRRDYLAAGKDKGFDEDDEFWARGLSNWAEDQAMPSLEDVRTLAGGIFPGLAKTVAGEDPKRLRELVRQTATRDDRRLAPREIESVGTAAQEIRAALDPLRAELERSSGAKKGAITKHLHRLLDQLLSGEELAGDDAELAASIDAKNLERAREIGNGLLRDVLERVDDDAGPEQVRELAYDLCLVEGARKEDLEAVQQWATKVKEMVADIENRREDTREAAVEGVRRLEDTWKLFRELDVKQVVNDEQLFRELKDRFGSPYGFGVYFRGGMGAEAIRELLRDLDLDQESRMLRDTIKTSKGQKQQRAIKRLKVVQAFITSENKPEWMVLEAVPVIPPELRPMVQLDGGRFATSDLNDLYRRVINRNNRLKRLLDLGAPEIIVNNEKRMLQEAVDALFDNGRRGRAVTGPGNRPLKSLSDMLKGKQGRFRQNLLGKRVDYSGRSVIVAGPNLKLHQCGLPKKMALELFKPFIYARLDAKGYSSTVKQAKKLVEKEKPEVWDILDEVIREHPVLLNRAPTLHRLGIQAFEPILIEGKAIQLHPLVCTAFNADFDGDQMAVHVPLSLEAQLEARVLMMSTNNILHPASGAPIIVPSQDMVLGLYYLSIMNQNEPGEGMAFADMGELHHALETKAVTLHTKIKGRYKGVDADGKQVSKIYETTPGRMIIGELLPKNPNVPFDIANQEMTKKNISKMIDTVYRHCGQKETVIFCDRIMQLGFGHACKAGISFGKDDMLIPDTKAALVAKTEAEAKDFEQQYNDGLITQGEKYNKVVDAWAKCSEKVAEEMMARIKAVEFDDNGRQKPMNSIYMMSHSGARGSPTQMRQLAGMRGLMAKPSGEIIETPIISNFKEGLTVLEYFNSTHGARKGLADTALKTANSGYLTRRLVDVAQDCIVTQTDCGTDKGLTMQPIVDAGQVVASLGQRILGRTALEDITHPVTGEVIVKGGKLIDERDVDAVEKAGIQSVTIRSALTCEVRTGVCAVCYGRDLARGTPVNIGEAVGVIAAQSIGEPGTQLTMRTFHMGGTAQVVDQSFLEASYEGKVAIRNRNVVRNSDGHLVVMGRNMAVLILDEGGKERAVHRVTYGSRIFVDDGDHVKRGQRIAEWDPYTRPILTEVGGKVAFEDLVDGISVQETADESTGITKREVIDWRSTPRGSDLKPAIVVTDDKGKPAKLAKGGDARFMLSVEAILSVEPGSTVQPGDVLARLPMESAKTKDITGGLPRVAELFEARRPKDHAIMAEIDGTVRFGRDYKNKRRIVIEPHDSTLEPVEYLIPKGKPFHLQDGDTIEKGDYILEGNPAPHDILAIKGVEELARYLVNEIQEVYRLQGVLINDKHIEVIVRQMLQKVEITEQGDSTYIPGDHVDVIELDEINDRLVEEGKKPAAGQPVLLGITKASLQTPSFISAASFQETTRVLTEAAVAGKTDTLQGLKENVIVGRLIPAGTGGTMSQIRRIATQRDELILDERRKASGAEVASPVLADMTTNAAE